MLVRPGVENTTGGVEKTQQSAQSVGELARCAAHFRGYAPKTIIFAMSQAQIGLDRRSRALTLAGVAALHLAALAALISAFGVEVAVESVRSIAAFNVTVPPPPPPPEPSPAPAAAKPAGPPAPRATATPVAAPKPKVVIRAKPAPVAAATGTPSRSGAAAAGVGTGAGGAGTGAGAGGRGGNGVIARRAEKIAGELKTRDFPRSGAGERDGRFIIVRYDVGTEGRVVNCRVIQSSGSAEADAITCRLIEQRFRYRPAEDAQGNPVTDQTGWKQWWWRPE